MSEKPSENPSSLRRNVNMLGTLLGDVIRDHKGETFFNKIEAIRQLSKAARSDELDDDGGNQKAEQQALLDLLHSLPDDELVPVVRSFSHFLNLTNIAEQFHLVSRDCETSYCVPDHFRELLKALKQKGFTDQQIAEKASELDIEVVLTAHPTEVTRRTLIQKYEQVFQCLNDLENQSLSDNEKQHVEERIRQLITQAWHTYEFRSKRPTPVDEAKGGFATIEHSLWNAVPQFVRKIDERLQAFTGHKLAIDAVPVHFSSWMGGDRDGNPFVTSVVTREVLLLSRWMAADLFLRDLKPLISELSMNDCSDELRALVGDSREPYWSLLKDLREKLKHTRQWCERGLARPGDANSAPTAGVLLDNEELIKPLRLCYESLHACGLGVIADGPLLDTLRRAYCFGLTLIKLDIRQESGRHTQALSELTKALGLGDYEHWEELERQSFLLKELQNPRPLLPHKWLPSPEVQEVIDTCRVVAAEGSRALNCYVISMAKQPSDVLAVALLLKECGVDFDMPIVPLFETLDDLDNAAECIRHLLSLPWYRGYCHGGQMVMIGYSDSAKDAGWMAAAWAQYRAMEAVTAECAEADVRLTLFHGRGGTIGRGGGPAHAAILSQPPGSVNNRLRVTEQGEMIRFKFGFPQVAVQSLMLYASATLEATLLPPPVPKQEWRDVMDQLSADSVKVYRGIVREEPDFVPYFRAVTPEMELGKLPLGSRPAKRKPNGGVESLRAIPWIFAWTQIRLMLPTWLGCGEALENAVQNGKRDVLEEMMTDWPFFKARLEMLEMVFMKTDSQLAKYYEDQLVPENLRYLGERLRLMLSSAIEVLLDLKEGDELMSSHPQNKEAIGLRNPYTDPLNFLQAELLQRVRSHEEGAEVGEELEKALMITIAGIAAGMRNTG
ncbi:phosphoenolpyruvate carboxylase [Endozoicomonas elysicola]|uniref:Phosphoenolpyruvate carboxylase n=1 Tax=Endozoicomonas elysicola TaxID=305900 RepID=A0A081KFK6_9GAMM|nr:phosphoenolpyruvate carboxylase [Endozoicomonas elysicola]KEI72932.1 phosphoenolpyruvate carboxylase [Endozoicomonas elysicola]